MKRYVRCSSNSVKHVELDITVILASPQQIAATKHDIVLEPRKMKLEYQLTDAQYNAYKNFLRTAASIIASAGFEFVDEYQSSKSYSYYIQFTPKLYEGVTKTDAGDPIPKKAGTDIILDVKFRLSDHYETEEDESSIGDTIGRAVTSGIAFKEFVVAGVTHESVNTALADIRNICEDVKVGDYSRVFAV